MYFKEIKMMEDEDIHHSILYRKIILIFSSMDLTNKLETEYNFFKVKQTFR